jgi:hypothetical protein
MHFLKTLLCHFHLSIHQARFQMARENCLPPHTIIIIIIIIINPLSLQLMLEIWRKGNTLYKWGIGEMANHMKYVKNAIVVFFPAQNNFH